MAKTHKKVGVPHVDGKPLKPTGAKAETAAKKAAVADQFAEADAKGDPKADDIDALQVGLQVRGY